MKKRDIIYGIIILVLIGVIVKLYKSSYSIPINSQALEEHLITEKNAANYAKNYTTVQKRILESSLSKLYHDTNYQETEFVWYSLESIKSYIGLLDRLQEKNPDATLSGIRFYLMSYPLNADTAAKGQQSIFMVPTVAQPIKDNSYIALNHLPVTVTSKNNPELKIIETLTENYRKKERIKSFYEGRKTTHQASFFNYNLFALNTMETEETAVTSTIFNEGEAFPPPRND